MFDEDDVARAHNDASPSVVRKGSPNRTISNTPEAAFKAGQIVYTPLIDLTKRRLVGSHPPLNLIVHATILPDQDRPGCTPSEIARWDPTRVRLLTTI